jgi:DNA-binding XRE family transcriptional regulator
MRKDIPNFEGIYSVDIDGNVFAYPNLAHRDEKKLKPRLRKNGYLYVSLRKDGKTIDYTVHRLVAKTFLDCIDGMDVNHINGERVDNSLVNLEIVSRSQNILHGMFVNKNGNAKFTHEQAEEIKSRVAMGERQCDIAKEFNVFKQTINQIIRGTGYKNSKIAIQYPKGAQ